MKTILVAIALTAAMVSSAAMAQSTSGLMFGGTVGFAKPSGSDNDAATIIGGRLSKQIQGNFSWEADVNVSIIDGQVGSNNDWNVHSVAGYGVYRTDGDVHLKAKLGVAYWDDDIDKDTSLTAGIGLGFRIGRGVLDVEYTQLNNRVDYITAGYSMPF